MKTTTALWTALILFAVSVVSAQEKKISEQEMNAVRKSASEKLKKQNYRVKMSSESYRMATDASPYYFITEISEYLPPDSSRVVYESKTAEKTTRIERITIGARKYSRSNNEDWRDVTVTGANGTGSGSGYLVGKALDNEKTVEYQYKGKVRLFNQTVDLYEIKTVTKYKLKDRQLISIYTERFWLNPEGLFIKTESESGDGMKITSHTVREYEYNLKDLKIEAPIK